MDRRKSIERVTAETKIRAIVNLDGVGDVSVNTGTHFIDHIITAFAKHAALDLKVEAVSKDGIAHHLIEDTAIAIGSAIDGALGERAGIARFGHASLPMDESLGEASVDLVRRPYSVVSLGIKRSRIEDVSSEDLVHFFQSLLSNMNCCVHLKTRYGDNDHHRAEAAAKSLAVAFRTAASADPRHSGPPSTKGMM